MIDHVAYFRSDKKYIIRGLALVAGTVLLLRDLISGACLRREPAAGSTTRPAAQSQKSSFVILMTQNKTPISFADGVFLFELRGY